MHASESDKLDTRKLDRMNKCSIKDERCISMSGTPVLILREGTNREKGKDALHASITAARTVADAVKSSLGPKGMDKMLVDSMGDVTITNDGHTILKEMDIQHPAAKMMVEVAKTQDDEVGDGTTSSVIVAGELLGKAEELIDKNVHPTLIIDGYRKAADKALEAIEKIAISIEPTSREDLKRIAATSMASKIVSEHKMHLSEITVSAILSVAEELEGKYKVDLDDIMMEKKAGESVANTQFINGIVVDKGVVHPGMPKRVEKAKIALLDAALEIEKTNFDAKINIESPDQMQAFLAQEETLIKNMVEKVDRTGANVLIAQKGIDDLAQHFLARKGTLVVRRARKSDMTKLAKATGGILITNLDDMTEKDLGYAELVEERKIGNDKMIFVEGCKNPRSVAILVRGGNQRLVDEAERSIHDALCVVRDVVQEPKIVAGGGAPEMDIARTIKEYGVTLSGKEQLAALAYAEALEIVPLVLAENGGLDPIDILSELRARHEKGGKWAGVGVLEGKVQDMEKLEVFEPLSVKKQIIKSATEAATMILKIDDVIAVGKTKTSSPPMGPQGGSAGGGEFV